MTGITLATSDGVELEAEVFVPAHPRAAVVIAHPNPLMGGDMHTPVPAALWRALPGLDAAGLRFNFRGVRRSTGSHDKGQAERLDVSAAMNYLEDVAGSCPLLLAGWSFGADVILAVDDHRIRGWFLAAAPLKVFDPDTMPARLSARPKLFAVPEFDHISPPAVTRAAVSGWTNTSAKTVDGTDHLFRGEMGALVKLFGEFIESIEFDPT